MKNYKDLIKEITKEDYQEGKANLHIHTTYSDGKGAFSDIVNQAKNKYKFLQ